MIKTLKIMLYAAISAVVFVTVTKQAVAMAMTDSAPASQTTESAPLVIYQNADNG